MRRACSPGGLMVFTIAANDLNPETDMQMGYGVAIQNMLKDPSIKLMAEIRFLKYKGVAID